MVAKIDSIPIAEEVCVSERISFKSAVALASQRGISVGGFLKLWNHGKVVAVARSAKEGVQGLLFERHALTMVIDNHAATTTGTVSLREAADHLNVLEREAYQLAKDGYLEAIHVKGAGNLRGQRVCRDSLAAFEVRYISLKRWCREMNLELSAGRRLIKVSSAVRLGPRLEVYLRSAMPPTSISSRQREEGRNIINELVASECVFSGAADT